MSWFRTGVAEKYRLVQDTYETIKTMMRCAVGVPDYFKVYVGMHQGLAFCPIFLDRLTDEVSQESPWRMMCADDIEL